MEIYIIILLLIILFSVWLHHYKTKQQKALCVQGLDNITHIKLLISAIQTHRGLSSALLNGDQSKQVLLATIEQQVKSEIKYLEEQRTLDKNGRWGSFTDHWGRLKQHDKGRDADNSFKQHTQLIANLLYLLEDEAERGHLNAGSFPKLPNIGFVWRELAVTTEIIGQSRAIGTGVATSKTCSSVHKIRLSFLQQNMQKTINSTLPKLSSLDRFTGEHKALLKVAKLKMEFLSSTIERELISAEQISINQDEYFALATDSIKALDSIFNHQIEQIQQIV
ncbi:nitrate- and nitrite sensing domain-containing protein [Psychromonas sp. SP041]|uniref:nitrate- and nitrite sensing domain-containing protein n=1 Tax=Psychromonas sp. SP041 TaxID=1365007 RepID=UPI0004071DC4|nr:nitrate- and nitrite sensing domain-containing protein [Psychromonas sp. SP041]